MSASKMVEYRQLGKSGLRVSVPILGAMSFGSSRWFPWVLDEDKALPLIKAAYDRGINTIDTANFYSNGESERVIAKFIAKYNVPRGELVIATKCYGLVAHEVSTITLGFANPGLREERQYVNQSGLSRQAIFNQVDASLKRLNTSYIDLLQIHRFDETIPVEETMKALHDVVESGKVRYIGASSMRCWQFAMMNEVAERRGWTKFVSMQDEYSLLYREEEREMIPYCNHNGIGLIPYGPLASGHLARPYGSDTARAASVKGTPYEHKYNTCDKTILTRVEELAKKKGLPMGQVALAWVQTKVASPIVGCSSVARLEEAIVQGVELTQEEIQYLEEPYEPRPPRGYDL